MTVKVPTENADQIVKAIMADTFFAQNEGESAADYTARQSNRRDKFVAQLEEYKTAATKFNADLKKGTEMLPEIFGAIEPTRQYRTPKEKKAAGIFGSLSF